jgi:hypothetical protein
MRSVPGGGLREDGQLLGRVERDGGGRLDPLEGGERFRDFAAVVVHVEAGQLDRAELNDVAVLREKNPLLKLL